MKATSDPTSNSSPNPHLSLWPHLAELLSIAVWDERFKWLESSIDALHTPTLVAVGDLSANSSLLVPGCFWGQRNVGQTTKGVGGAQGERKKSIFSYIILEWKWKHDP